MDEALVSFEFFPGRLIKLTWRYDVTLELIALDLNVVVVDNRLHLVFPFDRCGKLSFRNDEVVCVVHLVGHLVLLLCLILWLFGLNKVFVINFSFGLFSHRDFWLIVNVVSCTKFRGLTIAKS